MKKNTLSTLIILSSTTLLVLSYLSGTNASAVNGYERGSEQTKYINEIYYNKFDVKQEINSDEISVKINNEIQVSDKSLAGIVVYDLSNIDTSLLKNSNAINKPKKIKAKESKTTDNRWNIELTKEEINLLAKIVWVESRGESDQGQRAVVEVVFNRMIHWDLKGTLYEVLSEEGQFSSWKSIDTAEPTEKEYKNIQKVLEGKTNILDFDTVYFSTSPRNNDIATHIGGHWFCRYELKQNK